MFRRSEHQRKGNGNVSRTLVYHVRIIASIVLIIVMAAAAPGSHTHAASTPVMKCTTLFNLEWNYRQPSDVVAGTNDRVYVLDGVNNRVVVHASGGRHLFSFGSTGTGKGRPASARPRE